MKQTYLSLIAFFLPLLTLLANPAYPGKIPYRQPDGRVIYVQQHGDEWYHYTTDESGRVVALDERGFIVAAEMPSREEFDEAQQLRKAAYGPNRAWTPRTDMTLGERRIPVFLIEFQNKYFTVSDPVTSFSNLLNQSGYSYNGGTGSVRDYFMDNSHNQFRPVFDVYGPYRASGNVADYGGSNYAKGARTVLQAAVAYYNESIDYTQYDSNNDGKIDMVLFYFAGYNQADGGGVYNTDTIWPHQSSISSSTTYDGKKLSRYFCTSEYQGYNGSRMCGIGTTCHEFSHSLGLPDFYDTDYADNGSSGGLYQYSLMCSGSRLNNENTPPYMNSEELQMLGWMDAPPEISAIGEYTLSPIREYTAYTIPSSRDGEYFLVEARIKSGWDAYIPSGGLLLYHLDKSSRSISYNIYRTDENGDKVVSSTINRTAQQLWDNWDYYNAINVLGTHPLFHLIPAANQSSLNFTGDQKTIPFPGGKSVKSVLPKDWDYNEAKYMISEITLGSSAVSFEIRHGAVVGVYGRVLNSSAKPIQGAKVAIYPATAQSSSPRKASVNRAPSSTALKTATTDIDGAFYFALEDQEPGTFILEAECSGYVAQSVTLDLARVVIEHNIYLMKVGETASGDLIRYTGTGTQYGFGYGTAGMSVCAAISFSAEEMGLYQGKQIKSISFTANGGSGASGDIYVFVEMDGERIFTQQVSSPRYGSEMTVNVVNQECIISTPKETKIGYAVVESGLTYPILVETCSAENAGVIGKFSLESATTWQAMSTSSGYYTPLISASVGDPVQPDMGFNYIANPGGGSYTAGERFNLELVRTEYDVPQSVTWYFDGTQVSASSLTLTAGSHEVKALLRFADGSTDTLYLNLQVQ